MTELRITAGDFKNRKLESLPGKSLRPLSGRIKESLFSIISARVPGSLFLDLFAGTGNVSFEALSRGASRAVMVEKDSKSLGLIYRNADKLGLRDRIEVYESDVFGFYPSGISPDIIFAGPPYRGNLSSGILRHCLEAGIASEDNLVVIQHHRKEDVDNSGYRKIDSRVYGITALDFFVKDTA